MGGRDEEPTMVSMRMGYVPPKSRELKVARKNVLDSRPSTRRSVSACDANSLPVGWGSGASGSVGQWVSGSGVSGSGASGSRAGGSGAGGSGVKSHRVRGHRVGSLGRGSGGWEVTCSFDSR